MSDKTGISWTDATWNPVRGCSRVSEGCRHCYAERVAARFSDPGMPYHGLAKRLPMSTASKWTGEVRLIPEHLADPLRWKRPRRIFVNSMSDLFHEKLTNEQISAVFGVMAAAPQHTFQVLTKRAKRMREWFEWLRLDSAGPDQAWDVRASRCWGLTKRILAEHTNTPIESSVWNIEFLDKAHTVPWPLPNVWLGVSVENQEAADERIPELLKTPAAVRFLSCEPLIGPVRLNAWTGREHGLKAIGAPPGLHWVIVGCESGHGARPCSIEWIRAIRDLCAAAGVPMFLKQATQLGSEAVGGPLITPGDGSKRKGGGVIELPYLEGVQHAAFPEVRHV